MNPKETPSLTSEKVGELAISSAIGNNELTSVLPLISKTATSKSRESLISKKTKKKKKPEAKSLEFNSEGEDFDPLILEISKQDSTCAHPKCYKNVKLVGFKCSYCSLRHCVEHNLAEIHGCEVAVKRNARISESSKSMRVTTATTRDRAVLQRKLQSRIDKVSHQGKPRK